MTKRHPAFLRKARIGVAVLVAAAAAVGCGQSQSPEPSPAPTLTGEDQIRTAAESLTATGGPPGVLVVVQSGDQRHEIAEGTSDISSGAPMSATLPFRIASVSKAYNGAVVLSLVSAGELALTDSLAKVLPTAPKHWGKVTVAQVLQHTSGLPDYIKNKKFLREFIADPQMQRTPEQLIDYVRAEPPEFTPGTRYMYSDTDNIVAGLVAEHVTGKSYDDLLAAQVTQPLGLSVTKLPAAGETMPSPFIHGYAHEEGGSPAAPTDVSDMINPQLAWASGGMTTTAEELNTFFRGYTSGKLFDSDVMEAQRQFVPGAGGPPGPGGNSSGLSIYRYRTACGEFLGHTGNLPGYTTFVGATPDGTNSVVVAVNSQITPTTDALQFQALLDVENAALCAAVGRTR